MVLFGLFAGLLVLVAPALWRSVLIARRKSTLFRLGTFLGDSHDYDDAKAWGRDLGVHATLQFQEVSFAGDNLLGAWFPFRRTEVSAELGASYPLVIDLARRRGPWRSRGRHGAGPWDPRWDALVAPLDVARRLIDAETEAALHRLGVTELRLVSDLAPRFTLIMDGWLLDFEQAQQALHLVASLATRVETAFAEAEAATQAALRSEMLGAAYRGDPAASPAQHAAEQRSTELAMAQTELVRRRRFRSWTPVLAGLGFVGCLVGLFLISWWAAAGAVVLLFLTAS